jgi:hypothetical protein
VSPPKTNGWRRVVPTGLYLEARGARCYMARLKPCPFNARVRELSLKVVLIA